jgi:hypothetical protein
MSIKKDKTGELNRGLSNAKTLETNRDNRRQPRMRMRWNDGQEVRKAGEAKVYGPGTTNKVEDWT